MKNKEISKTDLIQQVLTLKNELNRKPMKRDSNSLNYRAKRLCGSWNNLMGACGYKVRFYQKIDSIKCQNFPSIYNRWLATSIIESGKF